MHKAGIDIGSRTIKLAIIKNSVLSDFWVTDTGIDPVSKIKKLLKGHKFDEIAATGYGRYLAQTHVGCKVITEIKAHALGADFIFPGCRTVIDIGGQDSKIISCEDGTVKSFEMNDRCAAGTGRFLEVMSTNLGYTIEEFSQQALEAKESVKINSMCTVFAESEVVSLISEGKNAKNIALGVHQSILNRIISMMGRTGAEPPVVFTGGVAKNRCMTALLEKNLGIKLLVPEEPQITGAVGAALSLQPVEENAKLTLQN